MSNEYDLLAGNPVLELFVQRSDSGKVSVRTQPVALYGVNNCDDYDEDEDGPEIQVEITLASANGETLRVLPAVSTDDQLEELSDVLGGLLGVGDLELTGAAGRPTFAAIPVELSPQEASFYLRYRSRHACTPSRPCCALARGCEVHAVCV